MTPNKVSVNHEIVLILTPLDKDSKSRNMPTFSMNRNLNYEEFFLAGMAKKSFDSRYLGAYQEKTYKSQSKTNICEVNSIKCH